MKTDSELLEEVTREMWATMRTEAPPPGEAPHWIESHDTQTGRIGWKRRALLDEWGRLQAKIRGISEPTDVQHGMDHRHLNHHRLTLAAIDSIIEREKSRDLLHLARAIRDDAAACLAVETLTTRRLSNQFDDWLNRPLFTRWLLMSKFRELTRDREPTHAEWREYRAQCLTVAKIWRIPPKPPC